MEQQDSHSLWQYCKNYIRFEGLVLPVMKNQENSHHTGVFTSKEWRNHQSWSVTEDYRAATVSHPAKSQIEMIYL